MNEPKREAWFLQYPGTAIQNRGYKDGVYVFRHKGEYPEPVPDLSGKGKARKIRPVAYDKIGVATIYKTDAGDTIWSPRRIRRKGRVFKQYEFLSLHKETALALAKAIIDMLAEEGITEGAVATKQESDAKVEQARSVDDRLKKIGVLR